MQRLTAYYVMGHTARRGVASRGHYDRFLLKEMYGNRVVTGLITYDSIMVSDRIVGVDPLACAAHTDQGQWKHGRPRRAPGNRPEKRGLSVHFRGQLQLPNGHVRQNGRLSYHPAAVRATIRHIAPTVHRKRFIYHT